MELNRKEFNFTWKAVELLGKNLYSNPWNALAELVANGLDAGACKILVFINLLNKNNSTIEILDDGSGMDEKQIDTYLKIGFDRRTCAPKDKEIMGRKGIGKLACLYLSNDYYLTTKTLSGESSSWHMEFNNSHHEDEKPYMSQIDKMPDSLLIQNFMGNKSGTLIKLTNVNLNGIGDEAIASLGYKLANQFVLSTLSKKNKRIFICVWDDPNKEKKFNEVEKTVAFKNFAFIDTFYKNNALKPQDLIDLKEHIVKVPAKVSDGEYKHNVKITNINLEDKCNLNIELTDKNGMKIQKKCELFGWIGVHSTIEKKFAIKNDEHFTKNRFFNPSQIRLYVRSKLAMENVLDILGITQAFLNYIEGEINFDILDDNDLNDIATSNRQGFDLSDKRMQKMIQILRPLVNSLIKDRLELSEDIKEKEKDFHNKIQTNAKKEYIEAIKKDFSEIKEKIQTINRSVIKDYPTVKIDFNILQQNFDEINMSMINGINGDLVKDSASAKTHYKLFFSYKSGNDLFLSHFIYRVLTELRGIQENEIFYQYQKNNDIDRYKFLDKQILDCIRDVNTKVIYFTTDKFNESEFSLFEGGAGWAVKYGKLSVVTDKYAHIPTWLREECEVILRNDGDRNFKLDRKKYEEIITFCNSVIKHINSGRKINMKQEIKPFSLLPSEKELEEKNEKCEEHYDKKLKRLWEKEIVQKSKKYLKNDASKSKIMEHNH